MLAPWEDPPLNYRLSIALVLVATLHLAGSAHAGDGTIDINQAKVLAAGGFPFNVNSSGSYRLSGNLTVSSTTADAIHISANNVTVDLNGFSIVGPGAGSSGGTGIGTSQSATSVTVRNGMVTGFLFGLLLNADSIVENVTANSNGAAISVGDRSIVRNSITNSGVLGGIVCNGSGCLIQSNVSENNSLDGIDCLGSGCLILNNTIENNGLQGMFANDSTTSYGSNVMNGNGGLNVLGGTSLGTGNTNLCEGSRC